MADFPIRIPKVSTAMFEAKLLSWLVEEGHKVNDGEPLFFIETDKVETEVAAPTTGLVHWTADLEETYEVGTQIGYIETED
jgi:pyruvate/2-oxoglutarate dehydrogenase complex dihydrolipoamide acyltransferase (E2) component